MTHDLGIQSIADGQANNQWQTSNDADAGIANALADLLTVSFASGDVTLTSTQYRSAMVFKPSGLSAARTLILPAVKRPFVFHNSDATYTVTLKSTDGGSPETATTIAVAPGEIFSGYTDGSSPGLFGAVVVTGTPTARPYDFGCSFGDAPAAGAVITRVRIGRAITIPANMSGSAGGVQTNPGATFDIDVQDDAVSIGTISVSTGGAVTFTTTSGTAKSVAAGSEITFVAPSSSPAEATVAGGSFVVLATED